MNFKFIKKSDQLVMPWKNGQGSTAQIDIIPEGAIFSDGSFRWRLSSATVSGTGSFSQFPGCDRWLVVLSGQGLLLNGETFGPFTPLKFAGEEVIECDLIKDEVVDLGIIYHRDHVHAEMKVLQISADASHKLRFEMQQVYIYCINGSAMVGEHRLSEGDCIRIGDESKSDSKEVILSSNLKNQTALLVSITLTEPKR